MYATGTKVSLEFSSKQYLPFFNHIMAELWLLESNAYHHLNLRKITKAWADNTRYHSHQSPPRMMLTQCVKGSSLAWNVEVHDMVELDAGSGSVVKTCKEKVQQLRTSRVSDF
jgi:hypothetical protein